MQRQIRLDIETGNGDYLSTIPTPLIPVGFTPLLDIACGSDYIDRLHGQQASDVAGSLNKYILSLKNDRINYLSLSDAQIALRPQVEAFLENLRDICAKHPKCTICILP